MARPRDKKYQPDIREPHDGDYVPKFPPPGGWNAREEAQNLINSENSKLPVRQHPDIGEPHDDDDYKPKSPSSGGDGHEVAQNLINSEKSTHPARQQPLIGEPRDGDYKPEPPLGGGNRHGETQILITLEKSKQPARQQPDIGEPRDGDYKPKPPPGGGNELEETQNRAADATIQRSSTGSIDRGVALVQITSEKRQALFKAWEESKRTKAENKASKKLSSLESWANSKKAAVEAEIKNIQEKHAAELKNKIAEINRTTEEKRALISASKKEEFVKLEHMAAKFRATGYKPKKLHRCFSCLNY